MGSKTIQLKKILWDEKNFVDVRPYKFNDPPKFREFKCSPYKMEAKIFPHGVAFWGKFIYEKGKMPKREFTWVDKKRDGIAAYNEAIKFAKAEKIL